MPRTLDIYDDPVWEYTVVTRVQPYIPACRRFWESYEKLNIVGTGVFPLEYPDLECPPGLFMRMSYAASRSPIKGVQAFPYVPTSYLQISGVAGGASKMVERVCLGYKCKIDEFTVVEKHNLPSTVQQGQFLAIIPTDVLLGNKSMGRYVYFTIQECLALSKGEIPGSAKLKFEKFKNIS